MWKSKKIRIKIIALALIVGVAGFSYGYMMMYGRSWSRNDSPPLLAVINESAQVEDVRNILSKRVNRQLRDEDIQYLIAHSTDHNAWKLTFERVTPKKPSWFQSEGSEWRLEGVIVRPIDSPSFTGWKVDGVKVIGEYRN